MTNREKISKLLKDDNIKDLVNQMDELKGSVAATYLLEAILANDLCMSDVLDMVKTENAYRR